MIILVPAEEVGSTTPSFLILLVYQKTSIDQSLQSIDYSVLDRTNRFNVFISIMEKIIYNYFPQEDDNYGVRSHKKHKSELQLSPPSFC